MKQIDEDFIAIGDSIIHLVEQFYAVYCEVPEGIEIILDELYDVEEKISEYLEEKEDD